MGVLALLSVGTISAAMQARRMTEDSIYLNTATAVAQGYIEQIKNMEFDSLDRAILPTLVNQGTDDPLQVSPAVSNPEIGNAGTDIINRKKIDLNNTPTNANDDMLMEFVVYITDLTNPGNGISNSRGIILRYNYVYTDSQRTRTYENILFTVRSEVQTF